MSRTLDASMVSHLATGKTKLSRCLRLDLRDGTTLGITDHDQDLSVGLGDSPADLYAADTGVLPSAVVLSVGLEADNFEARGPISALITRAAVLGGRFNQARARLFDVRWDSPTHLIRIMSGKVASARVEGGQFIFEVRSIADAFNQTIGRVLTPICSHDFGVGQCQAVPSVYAATVTAVSDDLSFTVSFTGATPSDADVLGGNVTFLTGVLAGCPPVEIFALTGSVVEVFAPLAELPEIGDTLTLTEGCDKLRATCVAKGQILNNGGFPEVPGTAQLLKYPVPGE